jgi:hypothetical protein
VPSIGLVDLLVSRRVEGEQQAVALGPLRAREVRRVEEPFIGHDGGLRDPRQACAQAVCDRLLGALARGEALRLHGQVAGEVAIELVVD